jgi:alpha-2-macroglobulin
MRNKRSYSSLNYLNILMIVALLIFSQCSEKSSRKSVMRMKLPDPPSAGFSRYISAFSGGVLATDDHVTIQFAFEMVDSAAIGTEAAEDIFSISPSVKGKPFWKDQRTIEFRPEEQLPHNKLFNVKFRLDKLLNVEKDFEEFAFGFVTMPQAANLYIENVQPYYENQQAYLRVRGVILTADAASHEAVRKIPELTKGFGEGYEISWIHEQKNRKHTFTIDKISRSNSALELVVNWSGKSIDAHEEGEESIEIPAVGKLRLIHTYFEQLPEPRISLQFSEPLAEQNIAGLIYFDDKKRLSTRINNNEIMVFADKNLNGSQMLSIEASVADINGNTLRERVVREFIFHDLKPAVRITGQGMIIPSSTDLLFPFEAVNLAAVDVDVVRIYENNILQFLQINQLDGDDQLRRVGRIVARKTLKLNSGNVVNLGQWNKFAIDLAEVIDPEPGAIYRVYLSFKKDYSLFPCTEGTPAIENIILNSLDTSWEMVSDEVRYWGAYDDYEYYYDYDWNERENPCHNTYYRNKITSRNILASNLGIIGKKQTDGVYHFAVTDLLTTKPVSGVSIALYSFQQQLLETVTTDGDGFASANPDGLPFVAVAAKDEQRAYLRLDDGSSLSVSMFDVDGARVQNGLKGFIYGERGIWRPGDTLFLNFVLEDQLQTLPKAYPVVFHLFNPLGQMVQSSVNKEGVNGFYHFRAITSPDAPTGSYTASFKIGGTEFTQSLRIETVMPNRLRIKINFNDNMLSGFGSSNGKLRAEWLHGGTANSLKTEVTATLNPSKTTFKDFKDYVFDDPTRKFQAETFPVFQGRLDASGEVNLNADFNLESSAPGILAATVETKVYEEGGAFSVDRFVLPFHAYKNYVGIKIPRGSGWGGMLQTDEDYEIEVVNVDMDGDLEGTSKLRVNIYKIGWRWWWNATDEYFGDFSAGSYNRPVHTQTLTANQGKAKFNFKLEYPEWGRYLIMVTNTESGHRSAAIAYFDWPSWRGASREGMQQAASMLSFTLNKEKYETGDDMAITFPSSEGGRALVSIENGTGVLERHWVETQSGNTTFRMEVTPEMAPNAYAHITLLQPHANTLNDLPIRLYGVMPFLVEDPDTRLEPRITMQDVLKPEQEVNIKVDEKEGRAMTYTLAMVDEGLLDLTRFKTPDPWNHFYAREALGTKTWDMYDYVMGAFGAEFSRLLGIGGDDYIQPPAENERANRFKPVVRFFGPFELDKGKSKTHTFTMPQYAGSVRVMVVAGKDAAYGNAEKTVAVRQSLMALGTLPRVLGPGEKVKFPVNVFALDETIKQVQISVATNEMISLSGNASQSMSFTAPGDKMAWFELQTPQREGVAKVTATVKSGAETVTFSIELDVRNANPRHTSVDNLMVEGGANGEIASILKGMQGTREVNIEISSIPAINLDKRLKFLMQYPHGCSEQIVSAAFPQLYLDVFSELTDADKQRIQTNVESVILRLPGRQLSNGGIAYWPGNDMANDWISSYAGHFAIEAQKKGFVLPSGFIDNWVRFQKDMANRWTPNVQNFGTDQMQAYRLFTLALAGKPEMGAMNRLRLQSNLSTQARWQLAAAYQLSGQDKAALELVENAPANIEPYRINYYTYGDARAIRQSSFLCFHG